MNAPLKHIIIIFSISLTVVSALNSNTSFKIIPLNRTGQMSMSTIVKRQHPLRVAVGYEKGKIEIIDIEKQKVVKTINQLSNSVRQTICHGSSGNFFARDIKRAVMLDYQGNTVYKWTPRDPIVGMSLAYNTTTTGFLILTHYKFIEEFIFSDRPSNQTESYHKIYDGFYNGIKIGTLSSDHQYLHVVTDQQKRFALVDPTVSFQIQIKPPPQPEGQAFPFQKKEVECPNKTASQGKNAINTRIKHGQVILERQFNFKIKDVFTDIKDHRHADAEGSLLITDQNVIYYAKKGTLVTFLPYQQFQDDKLLSYSFCEAKYFLTLHQSIQNNQKSFYLTYFQKETFIKDKVVELGSIFGEIKEVISMDCNGKAIVILTDEGLIVFDNVYEQEEQTEALNDYTVYAQWIMTALVLALFICCCRAKKQPEDTIIQSLLQEIDDQKQVEENQQSGQQKQNTSSSTVQANNPDHTQSRHTLNSKKGKSTSKQKGKRKSG